MKLNNKILLLILFFGLVLRIVTVFFVSYKVVQGDASVYNNYALDILHNKGLPQTAIHPPGYPIFLSGVYMLFGQNVLIVGIIQSIIGIITVYFVYLLAKGIFGKDELALLSSFLVSIDPFIVYFTGNVTSEIFFIFLLFFFLFLLSKSLNNNRYYAFFAGIVYGIAVLTRAALLGFIAFLIIGMLFFKPYRDMFRIGLLLFGIMVALLPWVIRNYQIYNKIVPATVQAGWNMWEAMNPEPYSPQACIKWIDEMRLETEGMNELEKDKYFMNKMFGYIKKYPDKYFLSALSRFLRFWRFYPYDPYPNRDKIISVAFFLPVLFLGIYGIVLSTGYYSKSFALLALLFYSCFSSLFFCPAIRYRLHLHPIMEIFAAYAVVVIISKVKKICTF